MPPSCSSPSSTSAVSGNRSRKGLSLSGCTRNRSLHCGREPASYLSQGVTRRPPRQSPAASRPRGFFVSRGHVDEYDAHAIERKWQSVWETEQSFHVDDPEPGAADDLHFYMLEMLPYPSGTLHMGHVLNYTLGDVITHFKRRNGHTVLRPMGFDSFGLPAENAAIREGGHPLEITERNIASITSQ